MFFSCTGSRQQAEFGLLVDQHIVFDRVTFLLAAVIGALGFLFFETLNRSLDTRSFA